MRASIVLLAGCSFTPGFALDVPDGPGDAPSDTPLPACVVASAGAEVPAAPAFIGGTGGGDRPVLGCGDGELPIGLGFDVSRDPIPNHGNQVAMVNLHARCGRIERRTTGLFTTTSLAVVDEQGGVGGNCSDYFPTTVAAEVLCPAGSVLVGVEGNRLDDTLYNTVALRCATLDAEGAVTSAITTLPIAGTGAHSNAPMQATCPAGTAIIGFRIKAGCGHDQLAPRCAPIACR